MMIFNSVRAKPIFFDILSSILFPSFYLITLITVILNLFLAFKNSTAQSKNQSPNLLKNPLSFSLEEFLKLGCSANSFNNSFSLLLSFLGILTITLTI